MSILSSGNTLEKDRPTAEILIGGELSPFEHEALYQLLRRHFQIEQPAYSEIQDETISTHIGIIFHSSYYRDFFTDNIQEDWRRLKDLFKQISYRRSQPGAAFTLSFLDKRLRLTFSLGILGGEALGSAMDQIAHLPGIIGQMISPDRMTEPLEQVVALFDQKSDRWHDFRAVDQKGERVYVFDETSFRWKISDREFWTDKILADYFVPGRS